jgi:hypothetical protein
MTGIRPLGQFRIRLLSRCCLGLASLFVLTVQTSSAIAQDSISESQWKRGYHGFNMICAGIGLTPVALKDVQNVQADELVIVVFGDLQPDDFKSLSWVMARHVENGGAMLVASDCTVGSAVGLTADITFRPLDSIPANENDWFNAIPDCPIVSDIRPHEITNGVTAIVANRPGALEPRLSSRIAYLPIQASSRRSYAFMATKENREGGRLLAVADQSVFSNQMIIYRDNALFTDQAMQWLVAGKRKHVLVISDGRSYTAQVPEDVELDLPSPSQKDVLDALKNLPPSALLEFANSVATVVEDEEMVNDFIHDSLDQIPDVKMNRFLMFLMFAVMACTFVVAFIWQKKLLRQTGSEVAFQRSRRDWKQRKTAQSRERQWAAHVLMDALCVDLAGQRYNDWPGFPIGLEFDDDRESKAVFKAMTKASNLYKSKPNSYWTRSRLKQLEQDVDQWRAFFESRLIVDADSVVAKNGQSAVSAG